MYKTITLDIEMSFTEALQYLLDGKCIGIKPKGNLNYIVKYKPKWMCKDTDSFLICWGRSVKENEIGNHTILIEQYLGKWHPVVINVNDLPTNILQSFVLENITNLK